MTLVVDIFKSLIPSRAKTSPSGWTSFNAPCCHHRGHAQDTRKRAGLRFDDGIVYNCFNCKYTASWKPGRQITEKFKSLCRWLGAGDDEINAMIFEALKTESPEYIPDVYVDKAKFTEKELPSGAMPLVKWLDATLTPDEEQSLANVVEYVVNRGFDPTSNRFYWTPEPGFTDRVILPYFFEGKIVGNTARKIKNGKPKYVSDQHPHFVFNTDEQLEDNKYVFVVEGQFDAYSVDGVGLLTNEVNDQQSRIINALGKKVIVIPDQDIAGLMLIQHAIDNGWSVAFPNWEDDVKDAAQAVERYGKLFVIVDAIKTAQEGEIKITVAKNNLEHKLKRLEQHESNN